MKYISTMNKLYCQLLLTLLLFFENPKHISGKICQASTQTVSVVTHCPTTSNEWKTAALKKRCEIITSHNCGTFVYHCLPNQYENATLEVCAPQWYILGFCAMFNTDEEQVIDNFNIDCTKVKQEDGGCPSRYISSDAYKYQYCFDRIKNNEPDSSIHLQKNNTSMVMDELTDEICHVCIIIYALLLTIATLLGILMVLCFKRVIMNKAKDIGNADGKVDEDHSSIKANGENTSDGIKISCDDEVKLLAYNDQGNADVSGKNQKENEESNDLVKDRNEKDHKKITNEQSEQIKQKDVTQGTLSQEEKEKDRMQLGENNSLLKEDNRSESTERIHPKKNSKTGIVQNSLRKSLKWLSEIPEAMGGLHVSTPMPMPQL